MAEIRWFGEYYHIKYETEDEAKEAGMYLGLWEKNFLRKLAKHTEFKVLSRDTILRPVINEKIGGSIGVKLQIELEESIDLFNFSSIFTHSPAL